MTPSNHSFWQTNSKTSYGGSNFLIIYSVNSSLSGESQGNMKRPAFHIRLRPSSLLDLTKDVTLSYGMKGGTRVFQTGETTFGKPKKEKVNIRGVKDLKPVAAFRMVLVGENITKELEMKEAHPELVEPNEPTEPTK